MARDATARLYDVDQHAITFTKLDQSKRYDMGEIAFRAKPGSLIELDQLHESIWASRLSRGTSSGLVSLEVTARGQVAAEGNRLILRVSGSDDYFVLDADPEEGQKVKFDQLRAAQVQGEKIVSVTGRLDGWSGRWPQMLRQLPPKPRKILVSEFEFVEEK